MNSIYNYDHYPQLLFHSSDHYEIKIKSTNCSNYIGHEIKSTKGMEHAKFKVQVLSYLMA